ncbi:MAG TPA: tetratricopeptide repeat protein [Nannocystis exedens]|nr:tetratricopeptide repeat protein [Nannocystis exedens]
MFHAEPNPDAGAHQPWQLCNSENHLFTLADLATVIEWIEDGQLRPDDQISRTGRHWLRLGDIPELSTVFIGFEGLPRVFSALATPPPAPGLGNLGPPPAFGESLGDIPAFGVGNSPGESQSMPVSMLDAVTKAVSAPPKPPLPGREGVVQKRRSHRSQPILVADLAGESIVAGAVSREDSAHEESAEGEVSSVGWSSSGLASASSSGLASASSSSSAATSATALDSGSDSGVAAGVSGSLASSSASSSGVAQVAESTPSASTPVVGLVSGAAEASQAAEASALRSPPAQAHVVEEEPEQKSNLGWLAIFGIAVGLAVMFGVPEIRAKILGKGNAVADEPVPVAKASSKVTPADLSVATSALQSLSLEETSRAQATLQKMIDAREKRSEPVDDLKLAQVELILTRALALEASVSIDATAVNGSARSRAEEDKRWALDLIGTIDASKVTDKVRWGRTQSLLAVVEGRLGEAANLVPAEAVELALVVKAASLWQIKDGPVPAGLIGGLQALSEPSTLARSLHALALWRSGDEEGAQKIVQAINQEVSDQPLAQTLGRALSAAIEAEREREEVPVEAVADSGRGSAGKVRRVRPPAEESPDSLPPKELTPRGCKKVRGGDPTAGVKLLLEALDANAINLDTYLCLGEGYTKMGNLGSSLAFYDRATKVASKNKAALRGAAGVAAKMGRTQKAVSYYKRLLALDPNDEAAKGYLKANGADVGTKGGGGETVEDPKTPEESTKPGGALLPVGD